MSVAQRRPDRTQGAGHDLFWQWCDKEELRLPSCTACNKLVWPVVQQCEHCGSTDFHWVRMSGSAKLVSWCSFQKDYYAGVLPLPWDAILVELDEGPLFLSNPHQLDIEDLRVDMPLALAFIVCEDTKGRFKLPVFGANRG